MPEVSPLLTPSSLASLRWIEFDFGNRFSDPPRDVQTVHQIHSARVTKPAPSVDADALIENTPGIAIGVKTADCVPILLADPVRRAVAAIHAGWRGTAARIVHEAIQAMATEFGTHPADLRAAIGPCIGPCCYQVGPDVAAQFGMQSGGPVHLDLSSMNREQLTTAGVLPDSISTSNACTQCDPAYHSFRRDRDAAGRMISWIRILSNPS